MKKIMASLVLVILVCMGLFLAAGRASNPKSNSGKLIVAASYYPLYDFARQVGGDKISAVNVTPAGSEPHDYEPSPQALVNTGKADVFIYNGGTMEPWVSKFLQDYKHTAVKASSGIALQASAEEPGSGAQDPHFWLDPVLAGKIANNIRDGLSKADPANSAYFAQNAKSYNAKLAQLDQEFASGLANCQQHTIITSHAAFGYLAKRYRFDVAAIAGLSPDEEPSAAKLAELSQLVKARGIQYVFFERLVSPRLADTIAQET